MTTLKFDVDLEDLEPLSVKVFEFLDDFLQPTSEVSDLAAKEKILELLNRKDLDSEPARGFSFTTLNLAEQIPYTHPSMVKLARLVDQVFSSQDYFADDNKDAKDDSKYAERYRIFNETVREVRFDPEDPAKYTNANAFLAHVHAEIWTSKPAPTLAVYELRDAFEYHQKHSRQDQEAYIMAAAEWIIIYGNAILDVVLAPLTEDQDTWFAGERYRANRAPRTWKGLVQHWLGLGPKANTRHLTIERWHFWRENFLAVSADEREKGLLYSQECKDLCQDAAEQMLRWEKIRKGNKGSA